MSPSSSIALGVYNPAQVPTGVLLSEFTARDGLMEDLLATLSGGGAEGALRHALIVGAPGSGKTTVLQVLKHRVEADAALSQAWVPLLFDEENYHLGDVAGFWLECLRLAEAALGQQGKVTYEALRISQESALEELAREAFMGLVQQAQRQVLLLVEHLDEVLAVAKDAKAQRRLRNFLKQKIAARVIGTAATAFPEMSLKGRPYHNLFRLHCLEGFTVEEMKAALQAMDEARAESSKSIYRPTREGYWRGLHMLTGGNPRLLKLTYQLMERRVSADFRAQLEGLVDASTPDFKQRIRHMSRQQRRVFDAIAHAWDAVQIAEISDSLRMPSNQISAQIQALVDAQLIAVSGGSLKRKRYQVADRFIHVCYFMRFSHSGRSRFEWFIRTMNVLLAPDPNAETLERLRELATPRVEAGERRLHAQLLVHAMLGIEEESLRLGDGHRGVRNLLKAEQSGPAQEEPGTFATMELFAMEYDLVRHVANMSAEQRSKLGYQHLSSTWWCIVASEAGKLQKTAFVEQCTKKAVELDPANATAWGILSAILLQRGRAREAMEAAERILRLTTAAAPCQLARTLSMTAQHALPGQREESEKRALEMAMQAPGQLLCTLGFWCYLRADVQACTELLPRLLTHLAGRSATADADGDPAHFLALGVCATLLAAGLDEEVEAAIAAAGVREALDTPLQVIYLCRDAGVRAVLAPERLALADAYLLEIDKRRTEMRRSRPAAG